MLNIFKHEKAALLGVHFRWDDRDHTNAAVALLPEMAAWVPEHRSAAAYSIADTRQCLEKGKLQVAAQFRKNIAGGRIQVRTRDLPVNVKDIFSGKILKKEPGLMALGEVKPTTVFFSDSGDSVYRAKYSKVPLTLENVRFPELGVGIYDVNWLWEYRLLDEDKSTKREDVWQERWRPLKVTQHRIFVLLEAPKFPWTPYRFPDYTAQPPFASPALLDALNIACKWARGAKSRAGIATAIARELNQSGRFTYDINPHYYKWTEFSISDTAGDGQQDGPAEFMNVFYLSKAVERLNGGHGNGEKANCIDCALIVMVLSNLLGCDLQVSKLQASDNTDTADPDFYQDNRFAVNRIRAIGHEDAETTMQGLSDEDGHFFSFHAVAWDLPQEMGQLEREDVDVSQEEVSAQLRIYDACIEFVATSDSEEERYLPAADLPFIGEEGASGYQDQLAAATELGRPRCRFQTATVIVPQLS